MATINVRQMDDNMVRHLKRRAAENDRSLEGEVRHVLRGAVEDDMAEKRDSFRLRGCGAEPKDMRGHLPEVLIREDRDSGHRTVRCV